MYFFGNFGRSEHSKNRKFHSKIGKTDILRCKMCVFWHFGPSKHSKKLAKTCKNWQNHTFYSVKLHFFDFQGGCQKHMWSSVWSSVGCQKHMWSSVWSSVVLSSSSSSSSASGRTDHDSGPAPSHGEGWGWTKASWSYPGWRDQEQIWAREPCVGWPQREALLPQIAPWWSEQDQCVIQWWAPGVP